MTGTPQAQMVHPRTYLENDSHGVYKKIHLYVNSTQDSSDGTTSPLYRWACENYSQGVHRIIYPQGQGLEGGQRANPLVFLVPSPSTAKNKVGVGHERDS